MLTPISLFHLLNDNPFSVANFMMSKIPKLLFSKKSHDLKSHLGDTAKYFYDKLSFIVY